MRSTSTRHRLMVPVVGAAASATTLFASIAPIAHNAAASSGVRDQPQAKTLRVAHTTSDGTYESCSAYFGFGKDSGAIDVVQFDVADTNGSDGIAHAVPTDTQVVLVLTNEDGGTLRCTPQEVTEAEWNEVLGNESWIPDVHKTAWPGPGHYIYPSVSYIPEIKDFGTVETVGFEVNGIPGGHTLVSPTGIVPLVQHFSAGGDAGSTVESPYVTKVIADAAGSASADAWNEALASCADDATPTDTPALRDALDAVYAYLDWGAFNPDYEISCWTVTEPNTRVGFSEGMAATATYDEPIRLAVPDQPAETTTTTTAPAVKSTSTPAAAKPVSATPTYTG